MSMVKIGNLKHFDTDNLSDEEYSLYLGMNKLDEAMGKEYLRCQNKPVKLQKLIDKYNEIIDGGKQYMCKDCKCKNEVEVLFAGISKDVIIPSKRDEDSCYDIYANFKEDSFIIHAGETKMIPTGLYSALPIGYGFELAERGSTGTRAMALRCGQVDAGFRGEIKVVITNLNNKPLLITKIEDEDELKILSEDYVIYPYKKAICQAKLIEIPKAKIIKTTVAHIQSISSDRGIGMLGSSKK